MKKYRVRPHYLLLPCDKVGRYNIVNGKTGVWSEFTYTAVGFAHAWQGKPYRVSVTEEHVISVELGR